MMSFFSEIVKRKKDKQVIIEDIKEKLKAKDFKTLNSKEKDELLETLSRLHDLI